MQRALLITLVAASYFLYAGARPWTLAPLLALAGLGALIAPSRTFSFHPSFRMLDLSLIALGAAIAIQLIPLPLAMVNRLSPHGEPVRASMRFHVGAQPEAAWLPLSINPDATWLALGTVILGVLSFWIARATFGAGGQTRAFLRAITLIGAVVALLAVVQKAITPRLMLFTLESEARSANPFGAFVNRNHMAAWLLLVAMLVAGYLAARVRTAPDFRSQWQPALKHFLVAGVVLGAMAWLLIVGAMLLTLSRSAVAALGVAAMVVWYAGRPRMTIERTNVPTVLGIAGALLIGATLFIDIDGWTSRVQHSLEEPGEFSRATIWRESVPVIRDFWLTGTGAGTYSDAMTQYQESRVWVESMQRWAHFNNAHSHYVQLASEGGLLLVVPALLALIALVALARSTIRAEKGEMFWVRLGAAAGLCGLAAQSIWETSLIMPANAVLAGVVAGLLVYRREVPRAETSLTAQRLTPRMS